MDLVYHESTFDRYLSDIRQRGDPNYVDKNGIPALDYAIYQYRSLPLVEALLRDGADVNKYTSFIEDDAIVEINHHFSVYKELGGNFPPLHIAVAFGQLEIVSILLDYGADPNAKTSKGIGPLEILLDLGKTKRLSVCTQLHSEDKKLEILKLLVRKGSDIKIYSRTPLIHYAITYKRHNIARYLISLGCSVNDVNTRTTAGESPLHISTTAECTRLLLENNASPNARDSLGKTALHYTSNTKCAKLLLQYNAEPNIVDNAGQTPLHCHCSYSNVACARLLVEHIADPNIVDNSGQTPLHCSSRSVECARLLLQHNADSNVRDNSGKTVYHYVMENISEENQKSQAEFISLLHDYHVDPNISDNQGRTAVFYLGSSPRWEDSALQIVLPTLTKLEQLGMAVGKRDVNGQPFIHVLVERCSRRRDSDTSNFEGIINFIAATPEVDINIQDFQNRTVLHLISAEGNWEFAQVLLKHNADMNAKDCDGNTPLHVAIQCKHWQLAKNILRWGLPKTNQEHSKCNICLRLRPDLIIFQRSNSLPNLPWSPQCYSVFESIFHLEDLYSTFPRMKNKYLCGTIDLYAKYLPSPTISKVFAARIRSTSLLQTCEENSVGDFHLVEKCDEEKCLIAKQVCRLVTDLVKKCEEMDSGFTCNLLLTGSTAEGTKMWAPDEFDFMMELTKLKGQCELEGKLRWVKVIVRNGYQFLWPDLLLEKDFFRLSATKMKNYVESLLRKASLRLDRNRYPNISFNICEYARKEDFIHRTKVGVKLTFYWLGEKYKKLLINVDLTPAIPFRPMELTSELRQQAISMGPESNFHAIPYIGQRDHYYSEWRVSSSQPELKLIQSMSPKQVNLYKCLKFLRDIHVVNITDVSSYILKCFIFDFVHGNEYSETEDFNSSLCQALRRLNFQAKEQFNSPRVLKHLKTFVWSLQI